MTEQSRDGILAHVATELLDEIVSSESEVNEELLRVAESLIEAHQFYAQLQFVDLIITRMKGLPFYLDAMDTLMEDVTVEELAEMTPDQKLRAISVVEKALKTQLDVVNTMLASKEASAVLIANLKETFRDKISLEDAEDSEEPNKFGNLSPDGRHRAIKAAISILRNPGGVSRNDEE